jgi:hypothetical protein
MKKMDFSVVLDEMAKDAVKGTSVDGREVSIDRPSALCFLSAYSVFCSTAAGIFATDIKLRAI